MDFLQKLFLGLLNCEAYFLPKLSLGQTFLHRFWLGMTYRKFCKLGRPQLLIDSFIYLFFYLFIVSCLIV